MAGLKAVPELVRRRPVLVASVVLCIVLVGWLLVLAWHLYAAKGDLTSAKDGVDTLSDKLKGDDPAATKAALAAVQADVDGSDHHLNAWSVVVASKVPWVGGNIAAVRTVNAAISELVNDAAPPIVGASTGVNGESFMPKDGAINVAAVERLTKPLQNADKVVRSSNANVQAIDTAGLVGPVRTQVEKAQDQLADAATITHSARIAASVLPAMAGEGTHRYLLMMQNNAEIRASGGLVGAFAELTAHDGRITLGAQGAGAVGDYGKLDHEATAMSDAESTLLTYKPSEGVRPNRPAWDVRDSTRSPDFARAGLFATNVVSAVDGTKFDGALSIDPVTLSYILKATGPLKLSDGSELTSDNAVSMLLHESYVKMSPLQQDVYFASAAKEIFSAVTSGKGSTTEMLKALKRGAQERRLLVWSKDPAVEKKLAGTRVSASITDPSPAIGLYFNNYVSSKMDYYLRYKVTGVARKSSADGQTYTVTAKLRSTAPKDAASMIPYISGDSERAPRGTIGIDTIMLAPSGGRLESVTLDGKQVAKATATLDKRPGAVTRINLSPGESKTLVFTVRSAKAQCKSTLLDVTPSVEAGNSSSVIRSSCR